MSQFEAKSAFDKESGIEQVKFGERRPVLETELNEMQEIQNHKRKEVIKSLYADGLVEGATISVENGIVTISNATAILEGEIITIDNLSIEASDEETIYLDMWYETLTYNDEIKKQGNQQSNQTIPNKILDHRIGLETSRRIQRQFTLSKTNDKEGHFYLKLGKVVAGNFVKEKEISFLKEIDTKVLKEIDTKVIKKEDFNEHLADYVQHPGVATATNIGNDYSVTLNPAPTSYVANMGIVVTINADSTGATTLNVNGLGAKPILKANGNTVSNLKANGVYTVRYNPSANGGNGAFILQGEGGDLSDIDKSNLINSINTIYDM